MMIVIAAFLLASVVLAYVQALQQEKPQPRPEFAEDKAEYLLFSRSGKNYLFVDTYRTRDEAEAMSCHIQQPMVLRCRKENCFNSSKVR